MVFRYSRKQRLCRGSTTFERASRPLTKATNQPTGSHGLYRFVVSNGARPFVVALYFPTAAANPWSMFRRSL